MLENNLVDHPVFFGLFGIHDEIALDVFLDAVDRLPGVLRQKLVDRGAHAQDLFRMKIDVRGLPAESRHPRLVNKDTRIWKRKALLRRATREQQRRNGRRLTHASGDDVGLDELHGVVDGETRGNGTARRIDVQLNVALGGLRLGEIASGPWQDWRRGRQSVVQ